MILKITNQCGMGCGHCLEESTITGLHMTDDIFERSLEFTKRVEGFAWSMGCPRTLLLSGGECTEHPDFVKYLDRVTALNFIPLIISNGMWLNDPALKAEILHSRRKLFIQITNDPRYYPTAPPRVDDPRIGYVDSLTHLIPLGRLGRKKGPHALPTKKAPSSFDLRSLTRSFGSFERAIFEIRKRALAGLSGHCIPSVSSDGTVTAGESNQCFGIGIGTVDSSVADLTRAVIEMKCNKCTLVDGLTLEQKRAIGEA